MSTTGNPLEVVHNLEGMNLPSGWTIQKKKEKKNTDTGGNFSVCYHVVDSSGKVAFMKVLNLARVLAQPGDQLKNIQHLIETFNFERNALDVCEQYRLRRVAAALEHGKIDIPGNPFGVYYIIFEQASGDIRRGMEDLANVPMAWMLRSLHQSASGLWQLNRKRIAHQDVKPSNVLLFPDVGVKVADLGSADIEGGTSPRGHYHYAGDPSYAPPELLYGEVSTDWERRRLGADMYLLGSLIVFVLFQVTMTSAVLKKMHHQHRPGFWPTGYRTALPYVRKAFAEVIEEIRAQLPEWLREEMIQIIQQLCEPDPNLRGNPRDIGAAPYSLERYVSILNRLAKKAEAMIPSP